MTSRTRNRAVVIFILTIACLNATTMLVCAGGTSRELPERIGELTVTGKVKVNGQPAATGGIVASGGTVETAKNSSTVVNLGKLGRVEVLPETKMKLRYDDESISILLATGSVRVQTGPGVAATITTKAD